MTLSERFARMADGYSQLVSASEAGEQLADAVRGQARSSSEQEAAAKSHVSAALDALMVMNTSLPEEQRLSYPEDLVLAGGV